MGEGEGISKAAGLDGAEASSALGRPPGNGLSAELAGGSGLAGMSLMSPSPKKSLHAKDA